MAMTCLNCPMCGGLFQYDSALSQPQLACPHCRGVLALPPLESPEISRNLDPASAAPLAKSGYSEPAAPIAEMLQLDCPACGGKFQFAASSVGRRVGCPMCAAVVVIPALPDKTQTARQPSDAATAPGGLVGESARMGSVGAGNVREGPAPLERAKKKKVEALLPPGAVLIAGNMELKEVPLPQAPHATSVGSRGENPSEREAAARAKREAGIKIVEQPNATKLIGHGIDQREIRVLSSEERVKRRFARNVVMFVMGVVILLATVYFLVR